MAVKQRELEKSGNDIRAIWTRIIEPPEAIQGAEQRRRVRLLSTLVVVIFPLTVMAGLAIPLATYPEAPWKSATFTAGFSASFAFLIVYWLNRTGRYMQGAALLVATFILAPYSAVILDDSPNFINRPFIGILAGAVLLASILFAQRRPLIITFIAGAVATLIFPVFVPGHDFANAFAPLITFSSTAALTFLYDDHRSKLENDRQAELRTANDALRASEMHLEQRVIDRTHELEIARKTAEQANQIKSQFLANMSHELRTPLNSILNFTAFVSDGVFGEVNDEQVNALQQSISSGKHLLALINDVLDITKIEAGLMDLFIQEVDLNEALGVVISMAKGLVKDKPIALNTEIEDKLPITYGDKRRLRQVFLNIISNAVKFTHEGSVTIRATHQGDRIRLEVQDTGIGVAPQDHSLVFESFKQAKHDMLDTPGTGLGMPLSKFFVEMHSGRIWFESVLNVGTTFFVELPVLTEAEANALMHQ